MDDGTAANWGVLVAGLGIVAVAATETGVAGWVTPETAAGPLAARHVVALGFVVAVLSFSTHRHGIAPRRQAGLGATGASVVAVLAALAAFFGPELWGGAETTVGIVPYLTVLIGVVAAALGRALAVGVPSDRLYTVARSLSVATGIGLVGYLVGAVVAQFGIFGAATLGLLGPGALDGTAVTGRMYVTLTVASGVGFVGFGVVVAGQLDRTVADLDLRVPDLRDAGYAAGGVVVLVVALAGFSFALELLGLEAARSSVETLARENPTFLLVMIPLSWLTIAPSEEFLYRNLIQKYLYDSFTGPRAVVLTSAVFGVVHFSQYSTGTPAQTALSLLLVFVLSTLLGVSYLRTENLLVPVFIHGTFNAVQFGLMYVQITGKTPL